MKIISCASYYGTGSSAVTDLVSEYSKVKSFGNFEFSLVHQMDGISDLEYYLVENHHRHNSEYAIRKFLRLARFCAGNKYLKRYEYYFNRRFMQLTNAYVNSLIQSKYKIIGYMRYYYDGGYYYYYFHRLIHKVLMKIIGVVKANNFLKKEDAYNCIIDEKKFIKCTKTYIKSLLEAINPENFPFVCLDQVVPANDLDRYLRYFDDIGVIVVERDPRDVFILGRYYWKDTIVPTDDVKVFVDWWKHTRHSGKYGKSSDSRVLYINFEDMIYKYDATNNKIEKHIGLSPADHMNKFKLFNPQKSVHNTCLWHNKECQTEIAYIEKKLQDYLYDFDKVRNNVILGDLVDNIEVF